MIAQIKMRRGTTAEWAAASPVVLAAGEPGYDTTEKKMKVGDGATEWADLDFLGACPYDVGDILTTINEASPAARWPGTVWAGVESGRFLVAAGDGYAATSTGGAASVALTQNEMPSHSHSLFDTAGGAVTFPAWTAKANGNVGGAAVQGYLTPTMTTGATQAHENRPPYYAVYMWRRTA